MADNDRIIDALLEARQAIDEALRALKGDETPPSLSASKSADPMLPAVGCKHQWVLSGFGSLTAECCQLCGTPKVNR